MPLYLKDSALLAVGSALAADEACCCESEAACPDVSDCMGTVVELEVAIAGVADSFCADCEVIDGTYIFNATLTTGPPLPSGSCIWIGEELVDEEHCGAGSDFIVRGNVGRQGTTYRLEAAIEDGTGFGGAFRITGIDAQDALDELCISGEVTVMLPNTSNAGLCDYSGATVSLTVRLP